MKKKKGLLFVINDFNIGGAEIFILRLGIKLQEDYDVYITDIYPQNSNSSFKERFLNNKFNYIPSSFKFSSKIDWILWKLNALFSLFGYYNFHKNFSKLKEDKYWANNFKSKNIQIVNSHLIASDFFVLTEIKPRLNFFKYKWVVTMHSSYNPLHFQNLKGDDKLNFQLKVTDIMNNCDAVVGVAEENFKIFKDVQINKQPKKIYLGYDPGNTFSVDSKNDDVFNIIMIGRGMKEKGWEIALNAFCNIKNDYTHAHFYLIGPLSDYMLSLKNKYECFQIHFEGYQEDPKPFYQIAHLSILPSFGESLPYSVIESLGHNLPVIVSNRGEMPEMIKDNDLLAGTLIEDSISGLPSSEHLTSILKHLIEDDVYYNELKNNTDSVFHKFSIENCVNQYLDLFKA